MPNKFFRTTDGGRTWENISEGFPGTFVRGLEVSPTTGDVFTGSAERLARAAAALPRRVGRPLHGAQRLGPALPRPALLAVPGGRGAGKCQVIDIC